MNTITVNDLLKEKRADLDLICGREKLARKIEKYGIHRPVMALGGDFDGFREGEIQVLSSEEGNVLRRAGKAQRARILARIFSMNIPCFMITGDVRLFNPLIAVARRKKVPVLRSSLACPELIRRVLCFLEERMSEESAVQGVMVEVYGMGVLLSGVTGIGKSECALALIRNGHRLIADDRVRVRKRSESIIVAFADGTTRHHIEVRGVGIVDVKSIFGVGSVRDAIKIDLVVELEMWSKAKEYDRLGIDEKYASILGVNIPKITIPVMPGRNLAVIVEIAVMNLRLRKQGFSAIKELDRRLIRITRKKDR